jgi:hypothetical protein
LKRTPAIEASLIYGISLVLAFVFFLITTDLQRALGYSQGLAVLVLFPSWALWAGVGFFLKGKTKFGRFLGNLSVSAVVAIAAILIIQGLSGAVSAAQAKILVGTFVYILTVYFFTTLFAAAATQFWIFRKVDAKLKTGELPYSSSNPGQKSSRKAKKK